LRLLHRYSKWKPVLHFGEMLVGEKSRFTASRASVWLKRVFGYAENK